HFSCDITDIRGISASKSMDHDIRDIDEFPVLRCRELAEPVTEEHLRKNMRHWELRLDRMLFAEYGVSLDIENYCTLRLFFDLSTLAGLSRRNLPEAGIRLLFQI
ncbi:DUF6685 family protein, partial [Salmonella enterica]